MRGGVGDDIRGHEVPSHGLVAVLGEGRCRGRGRLVEGEAAVAVDDGRHVQQLPVLGRPRLKGNQGSLIVQLELTQLGLNLPKTRFFKFSLLSVSPKSYNTVTLEKNSNL